MFCYVLIYAAVMLVSLKIATCALTNRQFSNEYLQELSNFNNIVEPDPSSIKTRSDNVEDSQNKQCPPNEKCFNDVNLINDKVKRELDQMGSVFVDRFLKNNNQQKRNLQEINESPFLEEEKNDDDDDGMIKDEQFMEEQAKAANITNATKVFIAELDNGSKNDESESNEQACQEAEEESKEKVKGFIEDNRKSKYANNDFLEMHFYKHLPNTGGIGISPKDEKTVYINLNPDDAKNHKNDYVALLSEGDKLVEVPAVKLRMVPEENGERLRRGFDDYDLFHNSKYRRQPQRIRIDPIDSFRTVKNEWTHIPVLFINTLSPLQSKFINNLNKRRSVVDSSENKYLHDAEELIQKVNTFLKMGSDDNSLKPAKAGLLVNPKNPSSSLTKPKLKTNDRKAVKKDIDEVSRFASSRDDFGNPLVNDEQFMENEINSMDSNKDENPMMVSPNKFNSFSRNDINNEGFVKSDSNSMENSQKFSEVDSASNKLFSSMPSSKSDTFVKNEVNSMELPSDRNNFAENFFNGEGIEPTKENLYSNNDVVNDGSMKNDASSFVENGLSETNFEPNF